MPRPAEGDPAPDFELEAQKGERVRLSTFKGKTVVLAFYPGDFTPVCTRQLCSYRDAFASLASTGATLLGISTDTPESHERFKQEKSLPFPLLSDPDGAVARSYSVRGLLGRAKRALFVIDPAGTIRFRKDEFLSLTYRGADEIHRLVATLGK